MKSATASKASRMEERASPMTPRRRPENQQLAVKASEVLEVKRLPFPFLFPCLGKIGLAPNDIASLSGSRS
jgi:hypothetical protein